MRQSGGYPAPLHQLLERRSKICFEPHKVSPAYRSASCAVSWCLHQNPSICPVACMECYIDRTAPLRNDSNSESLFIGSNKPHKPVPSSTIGRWIKEQLKEAKIDTLVFSAHSGRGAAASKALNRGVPVQSILNLGHWSRESTFAKFYKRSVPENTDLVGASILRSLQDSQDS